jgi:hypothetical protein
VAILSRWSIGRVFGAGVALLALLILWGPIPAGGGGVWGGEGTHVIRWGVLGNMTVTKHVTWYAAGDVPFRQDVAVSWPMFAVSCALSMGVAWLVSRLWGHRREFLE